MVKHPPPIRLPAEQDDGLRTEQCCFTKADLTIAVQSQDRLVFTTLGIEPCYITEEKFHQTIVVIVGLTDMKAGSPYSHHNLWINCYCDWEIR